MRRNLKDLESISSALEENPSRMGKEPRLKPGQPLVPPSAHCTLRFGLVGLDSLLSSYQDSTTLKLEPVHLYQNQPNLAEMQFLGRQKSEAF